MALTAEARLIWMTIVALSVEARLTWMTKVALAVETRLTRMTIVALVCGVCCECVTYPLVSWVRCGT